MLPKTPSTIPKLSDVVEAVDNDAR
jgi:hypothetical protein